MNGLIYKYTRSTKKQRKISVSKYNKTFKSFSQIFGYNKELLVNNKYPNSILANPLKNKFVPRRMCALAKLATLWDVNCLLARCTITVFLPSWCSIHFGGDTPIFPNTLYKMTLIELSLERFKSTK